jgi:sporulation protein YlmC with PRC-barrel domain
VVEEMQMPVEAVEKAGDVVGASVEGSDGASAGKIEDLLVDLETGRILLAILAHGGVAGIGADYAAVPPSKLSLDADGEKFRFADTAQSLKDAPKFDLKNWRENADSVKIAEIYRSYGVGPADPAPKSALPRASTREPASRTDEQVKTLRSETRPAEGAPLFTGQAERISELRGATLRNLADEKLGTVEELLLNLRAGRVVTAIISSGGFLGIGDEKSVVPPMALHWDPEAEVVHLDVTREKLMAAPRFRSDEWPKQDANYVNNVYRAFGYRGDRQEVRDLDNTALNRRDRDGAHLTPLDQGNSAEDIRITAQIRQALQDGDFSVNARNAKIITLNGKVTLRGTVNSDREKTQLEDIAEGVVGTDNVDNQLEVKQASEEK